MLGFMEVLDTAEEKMKFEELYMRYRSRMYAVAWKILQNERDTEDIVHDSFRIMIENFDKIKDVSSQRTWNYIVTIVKSKAITLYNFKKSQGRVTLEDWMETENDFNVEKTVVEKELVDILAEVISGLPYPYKDVLYLQYYNQLSGTEIADVLKKTPENIRKISQRAKMMLKKELMERGIGNEV